MLPVGLCCQCGPGVPWKCCPRGGATCESQESSLLAVTPTLKLVITLERNWSGSRVGCLEEKIEDAKTRREKPCDKCRACKHAGPFCLRYFSWKHSTHKVENLRWHVFLISSTPHFPQEVCGLHREKFGIDILLINCGGGVSSKRSLSYM